MKLILLIFYFISLSNNGDCYSPQVDRRFVYGVPYGITPGLSVPLNYHLHHPYPRYISPLQHQQVPPVKNSYPVNSEFLANYVSRPITYNRLSPYILPAQQQNHVQYTPQLFRSVKLPFTLSSISPGSSVSENFQDIPEEVGQSKPSIPAMARINLPPITKNFKDIKQFREYNGVSEYSFGHSGGPNARVEQRDENGVVTGGFSYIDPNGQIQTRTYIADDDGFFTAGTNIPEK